jgi:serine/threonine-protein kinase
VINRDINLATTLLQNAGLAERVINVPDKSASGTVIGQNPLGGSKVNDGSTVQLRVSQGPANILVPSVVGLSESEAKALLKRTGFKVRVQHESSSQYAAGSATKTDPPAGQSVPPGSGVTLFVSSGPAPIAIPRVVGQTQAEATAQLSSLGFAVNPSTQVSSSDPPGTVISQSPTGTAPPHSTIDIVVAKAPPTAKVPNVVGSKAAAATASLKGAGFTVTETSKQVTRPADNGIVLSQTPAGDKEAPKGSAVGIVVGKYKAPATPPPTTPTSPTSPSTTPTTSTTTTGGQ